MALTRKLWLIVKGWAEVTNLLLIGTYGLHWNNYPTCVRTRPNENIYAGLLPQYR